MVPAQRVERLDEPDEVTGNQPRPLMNHLIERVLAVGSRFAPIDRSGRIVDLGSIEGNVFAVTLHGQLLQIGGESFEILLVWQYRDSLGPEKITVPHPQKPHEHREIALKRRGPEVLVHFVKAVE